MSRAGRRELAHGDSAPGGPAGFSCGRCRPSSLHFVAAIILFAGAISTDCSKKQEEIAPAVTVQVATVRTGRIERTIVSDAVIYPLHQAALTPKISAPVRKFLVERGSRVHAGQLLAQLENRDLAAAVTDNKGSFDQAQAAYETATQQTLPEEIRKAELDARSARDAMEVAKKLFDSQTNLFQQGATARKNVDDANLAYVQARNQYDLALKHLDSLKKLGKAQELKSAEGQLTSARGKYEGAEATLSYAEIRSPIDGVVTERPLYAGEMAAAGVPLITVMDLSQIVARAHVDQEQAAALKIGDAATLEVPGSGDVSGKVTMISPALDSGSTTVEIWVQAANPHNQIRPGVSARLSIVAETVADARVIPLPAVLTAPDGTTSVMVIDAQNTPHLRSVKLGIRNAGNVQVLEGLQAGERVATAGAYDLSKEDSELLNKTKIQIESAPAPVPPEDENGH